MSNESKRYHSRGFLLLSQLETSGYRYYPPEAGVRLYTGDALYMSSGTASLAADADWTIAFCGIAGCDLTAAEATAGKKIAVIPPLLQYQFIVPVGNNTVLVATTHIGNAYGPHSVAYSLDVSDTDETVYRFFVDDIDISAAAIAANTYGYAIGHFTHVT